MIMYDWTYFLLLPAILAALWAQSNVQNTYRKYSKIRSFQGYTGAQIARKILDDNGLSYVKVEFAQGEGLTDHFDPRANVVRLSNDVYNSTSIAAIGIAAHETGHAIQYMEEYGPIKVRNAIIPITNLGSKAALPLVIIGLIFSIPEIAFIGVLAFSIAVIFQVITLPVEFNASKRAVTILEANNYLSTEELRGSKKVLSAAAMTYLAAAFVSLMQLIRLLLIARDSRRR
ncbi:MAG: zinc metallopeptidase [Clostridia bacterium]|nr:zinc metallopeptidase [Clostridia bacterium]